MIECATELSSGSYAGRMHDRQQIDARVLAHAPMGELNMLTVLNISIKAKEGSSAFRSQRYLDFLDILLTAKDDDDVGLSDREIRNEVDTFLFEGRPSRA